MVPVNKEKLLRSREQFITRSTEKLTHCASYWAVIITNLLTVETDADENFSNISTISLVAALKNALDFRNPKNFSL